MDWQSNLPIWYDYIEIMPKSINYTHTYIYIHVNKQKKPRNRRHMIPGAHYIFYFEIQPPHKPPKEDLPVREYLV